MKKTSKMMSGKTAYISVTVLFLLVFVVTACNTTDGVSGVQKADTRSLNEYLQRGYENLAEYEEFLDLDKEAAVRFKEKAREARYGRRVIADIPDDLPVADEVKEKMIAGRAALADALEHLNTDSNAISLAEAQMNYDCWLERESDGSENSDACKDLFYKALKNLSLPEDSKDSIYFGSNEAVLDEGALAVVLRVSERFVESDLWRVRLVGRADKSGSYEANVILSMRRAIAVRNSLAQHGIDPDKVVIEAVGAVETNVSEDLDESHARRVDLYIAPVYVAFDHKGPDIHKIVPHFFSAQDD